MKRADERRLQVVMHADSTHVSLFERLRTTDDTPAWREFERRYGPLIVSYCMRRGLQLFDAEDVRQVVMAGLARSLAGFRYEPSRGRFRDYLGRIVRNALVAFMRAERDGPRTLDGRALEIAEIEGPVAADADWERQWVRRHCQLAIEHFRATESGRDSEVFELLIAGQNAPRIAEAMSMTPEAVRKVTQRVRERLRAALHERLRQEEEGHVRPT